MTRFLGALGRYSSRNLVYAGGQKTKICNLARCNFARENGLPKYPSTVSREIHLSQFDGSRGETIHSSDNVHYIPVQFLC